MNRENLEDKEIHETVFVADQITQLFRDNKVSLVTGINACLTTVLNGLNSVGDIETVNSLSKALDEVFGKGIHIHKKEIEVFSGLQ